MSKRTEYRINRCRDFIVLGRKLRGNEQNFHITKETYERLRALAEEIWPIEDRLTEFRKKLSTYPWFHDLKVVGTYIDVQFKRQVSLEETSEVNSVFCGSGYTVRWSGLPDGTAMTWGLG